MVGLGAMVPRGLPSFWISSAPFGWIVNTLKDLTSLSSCQYHAQSWGVFKPHKSKPEQNLSQTSFLMFFPEIPVSLAQLPASSLLQLPLLHSRCSDSQVLSSGRIISILGLRGKWKIWWGRGYWSGFYRDYSAQLGMGEAGMLPWRWCHNVASSYIPQSSLCRNQEGIWPEVSSSGFQCVGT